MSTDQSVSIADIDDNELKVIDQTTTCDMTKTSTVIPVIEGNDQSFAVKISAAVPWILQRNISGESDKLLTEISECQYQLLLLIFGLAHKDVSFCGLLTSMNDHLRNEEEWDNFYELLKTKFDFAVSEVFDIFSCGISIMKCNTVSINIPINIFKAMSCFGKGKGLLHLAIDNVELMELLIELEFDVNERNEKGETPLHVAAAKGFDRTTTALLEHGAWHFSLNDEGYTPLWLAVLNNCISTVDILLKKTVNVNVQLPKRKTLIRVAAEANSAEVVKLLIKYRANLNIKYEDDLSLLHIVVSKGYREITEILVNKGALSWRNKFGYYPIHVAAIHGYYEIIEVLLRVGVSIDEEDVERNSPLHLAIRNKHMTAVEYLISEGANVNKANSYRDRPLNEATSIEDTNLIRLLVACGADIKCASESLLCSAISMGNINLFDTLIELGAEPTHRVLRKLNENDSVKMLGQWIIVGNKLVRIGQ